MKPEPVPAASLRTRLVAVLSAPLLAVLLFSVVADYRNALALAGELGDQSLMSLAVALASRLEREDKDEKIEVDLPPAADQILRADGVDEVRYLVVDSRGRLIAGDAGLLPNLPPVRPKSVQLADFETEGQRWRMVTYPYVSPQLDATVMVVRTTRRLDQNAERILGLVIWPNVVQIVAAVGLLLVGVSVGLRPLDRLGSAIAARAPDDLEPLPEQRVPAEAMPLVSALNQLLEHLRAAGRAQQAFLSNAAHQLRTPLAGLQTQLELAASDPPERAHRRIADMLLAVRRLGHFTQQMLALARASRDAGAADRHQPLDLAQLLEASASAFLDRAIERDIDLGFELHEAVVLGADWMLREMIANLIDNALAYTPRAGVVTARCRRCADGRVRLEVEDSGPGIPPAERGRVLERFYRLPGTPGPGSGLGLAVVREVAERHAATVGIGEGAGGRGTCVVIDFPGYTP